MFSKAHTVRLAALGIFFVAVASVVYNFPDQLRSAGIPIPSFFSDEFRLGLDLRGGTHLVYQADVSHIPSNERGSALEGVRDVIERRVNAFGVAEPVIQTTKTGDDWRLIIELAGISDVNEAINLIGETPLLEFKEQRPTSQITLSDEKRAELEAFNAAAQTQAEEVLTQAQASGADFAELAKTYSQDSSATNGGDLGFVKKGLFVPEFEDACFDALTVGQVTPSLVQTNFGYHVIRKEAERGMGEEYEARCSHILIQTKTEADYLEPNDLWSHTDLTGERLKRAQVSFDPTTQFPQISLEFDKAGSELFAEITARNIGQPVAIFLDGTPISTPTVQQTITNGQAVISGQFSISEARLLAQRLNAGALPVPIELISQQTVGASLGRLSIEKSLQAGLIGLAVLCLFMIVYYRLLGLAAVGALLVYGLVVLGIFKVIPVTLTLAGIAGFILSLGMAVDANILIFERTKEELSTGKPLKASFAEGFKRAWPSIFDGNISTLITCLILMGFSTSLIKGFAVTLAIGILVSMASAMIVTRILLYLLTQMSWLTAPWLYGVKRKNT